MMEAIAICQRPNSMILILFSPARRAERSADSGKNTVGLRVLAFTDQAECVFVLIAPTGTSVSKITGAHGTADKIVPN